MGDVDRERCEDTVVALDSASLSMDDRGWQKMLRKQGSKMAQRVKGLASKPDSLS